MTSRAMVLTTNVITNRNRPARISAGIPSGLPPASPNFSAIVDAIVSPPGSVRCQLMVNPELRTKATAIVSPSARPRPSIEAEISPERPNGSTAERITSHLVAPSAQAASMVSRGVCSSTSRDTAETTGMIMMASTRPAISRLLPYWPASVAVRLWKIGIQPKYSESHIWKPWVCGIRKYRPHIPNTSDGTAASRSTTAPSVVAIRRGA